MIKNLDYNLISNGKNVILFLHGWGLDKNSFDCVIKKIYSNISIMSLDFFGFGNSETPEKYFDTYEYAYHVFLLISELNFENLIIVGHSFGGRIAIILSAVFGINVKSIILTSSAGLNRMSIVKFVKIRLYKTLKFLVSKKIISRNFLLCFGSSDYKKLDNNIRGVFNKIVNQDLCFLLKKIIGNSYLIWDKKDKITPFWICKKMRKNIKLSKIVLFKSGGHFCYMYNVNKFMVYVFNLINQI